MDSNSILQAAKKIKAGDIVAFPTETVYGLGANAYSSSACRKIYDAKSRPSYNPLIVHVSSLEDAMKIGYFSQIALEIAEIFWPGPLSIVVPLKDKQISPLVTAGLDTIAIRLPSHPIALALIKESNCLIAAPSANPSNYISPTLCEHVKSHFEKLDILILDGGKSDIGLESTIIDCSTEKNIILRHGSITQENFISNNIEICKNNSNLINAPGMLNKHYSPHTKIRLNARYAQNNEIALNFGNNIVKNSIFSLNLSESENLNEAAANLYSMLRELDIYAIEHDINSIAIASIPLKEVGAAINDKLQRAAA